MKEWTINVPFLQSSRFSEHDPLSSDFKDLEGAMFHFLIRRRSVSYLKRRDKKLKSQGITNLDFVLGCSPLSQPIVGRKIWDSTSNFLATSDDCNY